MKYWTLNVRGIGLKKKQIHLKRLIADDNIDTVAVQEAKLACDEKRANSLDVFLSNYEVTVSHTVGNFASCFLFVKKYLPQTELVT